MTIVHKESLEQIDRLAHETITVFQSDLRPDGTFKTKIFQTIRSLSAHIANDYGDRYLLELIQNAYDALSEKETSGRIKILFIPQDGEWGTLYIANGGRPFQWANVESICAIGLSEKPAGENIGNKGLGFRSVLRISHEPKIFSLLGDGKNTSEYGYCFRFATGKDFTRWTNEPIVLEQLPRQLPPFCIPYPLDNVPLQIASLIDEGFVSVISLPLISESARKSVYEQMDLLRSGPAPLILFLKRLQVLDVVITGQPELSFTLTRTNKEIKSLTETSPLLTLIELNNDQRYLVAWRYIPEGQVKAKIDESIELQQLHPSWKEWRGDGELAIAVYLDEMTSQNLLYTFLPMGEAAECPFNGFLHGAFYPKSDRTSLHAGSPLNTMYIEEAIRLSVHAALTIRLLADIQDSLLSYEQCSRVIVDFLSWHGVASIKGYGTNDYAKRLGEAFLAFGGTIGERDILPVIRGKKLDSWGAPIEVLEWDNSNFSVLTAERISRLGKSPVLSENLGKIRTKRFIETWTEYISKQLFDPSTEELADVVEKVAEELLLIRADIPTWTGFYCDLLTLVNKYQRLAIPSAIVDKKILLCSGNRLLSSVTLAPAKPNSKKKKRKKGRPVQNVGAVVFSPSDRLMKSGSEDAINEELFRVPQQLEQGFSFLSQKLEWYGDLNDVRQFFEKHRLVRKYDASELISNVSRIQRESNDKMARRQALTWLFRLYVTRGDYVSGSLSSAEIYVPVGKEGWVSARQAYFSHGWSQSGRISTLLEQFFESASSFSKEISGLKKMLLHPPSKKPFSVGNISEWYAFLKLIGVKVGLYPINLDSRRINSLSDISIKNIGSLLNLDEETIRIWEYAVGKFNILYYGNNKLEQSSKIVWWPGQGDFNLFPPETKKLNARLLLEWIKITDYTESDLIIEYYHNYYRYAQRFTWPTPFLAFFREGAWFPVENTLGNQKGVTFKCLKEVWLPEEDRDRPRPFMPQIPSEFGIRQTVLSDEARNRLKSWGNVNVVNDPQCLFGQISMLGHIFKDDQVEEYCKREFINLYGATWKLLAENGEQKWPNKRPDWIVVRNKGSYCTYELPVKDVNICNDVTGFLKVYVPDDGKSLVCTLLEELGHNIFDFEVNHPNIRALIKDLLGSAFSATSSVPVEIIVNDIPFESTTEEMKQLIELVPSFTALLCLAMECLTGTSAQQLPVDRGVMIDRLRKIRVMLCREISFNIAGSPKPLPANYYGVLGHMDKDVPCLLLETENEQLTWEQIRDAGPALCRLLNQADLASVIKNACSAMERQGIPIHSKFSKADHLDSLCRELNLTRPQAETALAIEIGDKKRIEMVLRPLVFYCVGEEGFTVFEQIRERSTNLDELLKDVEPLFENSVLEFQFIYDCVKESNSYSFIQKRLDLEFAKFNECIVNTNGEVYAITYPDEHKISMKIFLEEHRDRLVACLQNRYLTTFDNQGELVDFVTLKNELLTLPPDSSWLLSYEEPPLDVITAMVNAWLERKGFPRFDTFDPKLPLWSMVIKANEKTLKQFIVNKIKVINAWFQANNSPVSGCWALPELAGGTIKSELDKIGAFDFRELDDELLLKWMVKAGVWPDGMPASLDLEVLGLTEENLQKAEKFVSEERAAQEKARRSVRFGSTDIDPYDADYEALSKLIQNGLPKDLLKTSLGNYADIHKIEKKPTSGRPGKGGGGSTPKVPSEKADLIGFMGECAVYHWLKTRFPKKDIESSWKSKNREHLYAEAGSDSLGYDYHLEYDRRNWFLEVKASLQNPMVFEMGETEVDKAKECAILGKSEYSIIYVSNIEDPSKMKILVLPNPFSEEGKKVFGRPREKFRYSFGE